MEREPKKYEFSYLLSPSIPEDGVLEHTGKITGAVEEANGIIEHAEEPKKRKLAFPVKKETTAYFGWVTFRMKPDAVLGLKKKLGEADILRSMLIQAPEEIELPRLRTIATKAPAEPKPIPRETEESGERLDLEALDKKLEEILGK